MCLVAVAWNAHPRWRLVLAGNRDEFHARPSAPLARWAGKPGILAGRDLEAGGTWLGVGENGRAGVVTNVRDPFASKDGHSRGELLVEYLSAASGACDHAVEMVARGAEYRPFNLLLFDAQEASVVTNHPKAFSRALAFGIHAFSNGPPGAVWPKTRRLADALRAWLAQDDGPLALFAPLADETLAPDSELPDTGVGVEIERRLSPAFIRGETYGTRASTIVAIAPDGTGFILERRFGPSGRFEGESSLAFGADGIKA
jgi:uncharacterized protein with NRDE domain